MAQTSFQIPARYGWLVMPGILAFLMTFVVSGISTIRAIGLVPGFFSTWMTSWMLSYAVAYPTLLVMLPIVRRIMAVIMAPPPQA